MWLLSGWSVGLDEGRAGVDVPRTQVVLAVVYKQISLSDQVYPDVWQR